MTYLPSKFVKNKELLVFGGLDQVGFTNNTYYGSSSPYGSGSVGTGFGYVYVRATTSTSDTSSLSSVYRRTTDMIDISDYDKLCVHWQGLKNVAAGSRLGDGGGSWLGIGQVTTQDYWTSVFNASISHAYNAGWSKQTEELDISGYSGSYYVGMLVRQDENDSANTDQEMRIINLWLE